MGMSVVAGDPGWGSSGHPAERAVAEGCVISTAPRRGRGDSAAEECPCLLPRCYRDPGKQPGPTAPARCGAARWWGERSARTPRLQLAPPHRNPWAQEGQWGRQSWDAGAQFELACRVQGWVPCRAMPALPGSASGAPGCCACGTGVTQTGTTPSQWHPPAQQTPLGAQPCFGALPTGLGCRGGCSGHGRAVTGAAAATNAFAVSAGPAREAAWKKAQCWEPGRRRQEKQPPFGGAFQAANEINTARCRAARPHSAGQGAPAVHPCSPSSGETEARWAAV